MKPYHKNPRKITNGQLEKLEENLNDLGDLSGIVHDLNSDQVIGGNQRSKVFDINECAIELTHTFDRPDEQGTVAHGFVVWRGKRYAYRQVRWTPRQCERANITANRLGGEWDFDILTDNFDMGDLQEWGFDADELGLSDDAGVGEGADTEPQIDRAEELRAEWGVESGQLWRLGEHRLICGDCTDAEVVRRLMDRERAALVHADPPYGMGKQEDGIANDNLYREKLDAFQMQWWQAARPCVEDNGSVYIWGNAEDLWRLWYCGGLRASERLTLRNEIVWQKESGQGSNSDAHRMYATATERCLFFMLGEQGFNNNADNYWEGWEPVRAYLDGERIRAGFSGADVSNITGTASMYKHWFTRSQFEFITEKYYTMLQKAAGGDAFKREYDDLKREFYATRAYFGNTHDDMTDVWQFPRVQGDDRHGHATPKPLAMTERAIKSSAPEGAIVYAPFGGTGPEIIACHNANRRARTCELNAAYCAVILQRWADHTGQAPELMGD